MKETSDALKEGIAFRTKNKELLERLASTDHVHPDEVLLSHFFPIGTHKQDKFGSPIFIIRSGIGNMDRAMEVLPDSAIENALIFSKEKMYRICDAESRKRGYIVKMVAVQDFKYGSVFDFNRRFMGVLGEASKKLEKVYAQLLGAGVIVNPLSTIKVMMTLAKLVLPATTFQKFRICGAASTRTGDITTCPIATRAFDLSDLPTFLGGKCNCSGKGCVAGVPNDQKEKVQVLEDEVRKLLKERQEVK